MLTMWPKDVIAICCADIHLSLKPPVWRSNEPDWLEAQARPLKEVENIRKKYDCPVLCAGDVFDIWDSKAELINWTMKNLPLDVWSVVGQHDLPYHSYLNIEKSAFWTLVEANKMGYDGVFTQPRLMNGIMCLYGFGFDKSIKPLGTFKKSKLLDVCIAHQYKWLSGYSYPDAPREDKLGMKTCRFTNGKWNGYDVVIFGDNHIGFQTKLGKTTIFNCGALIRRDSDQKDYRPQVGLLLKNGEIIPHYLDISQDKHIDTKKAKVVESMLKKVNVKKFFSSLNNLNNQDGQIAFEEHLSRILRKNKVDEEVKQIILKTVENCR